MLLKSFFYKALNKLCSADITQVLFLNKSTFVEPVIASEIVCRSLSESDLQTLARSGTFGLTDLFIEDFLAYEFIAIGATIEGRVVGIIFLCSNTIPSRHNSGGSVFNGISVDMPDGVYYLFKVDVLPSARGRRVNAAMIAFAFQSLESEGLRSIVTTTDWTNQPFLRSASRLGFTCCAHASEFVVAGRHSYLLPKPLNPNSYNATKDLTSRDLGTIRFKGN